MGNRLARHRLRTAARTGDAAELRRLLADGADPDATDRSDMGRTALHYASCEGHVAAVAALLAGGAGVDARDRWGSTPLHGASSGGHGAVARALLAAGADVRAAQALHGWTALHVASFWGHAAAVRALLAAGADVRARDAKGRTARDLAARWGYHAIVVLLGAPRRTAGDAGPGDPVPAADAGRDLPPPVPLAPEPASDLVCPICMTVPADPLLTPCQHLFCAGCLRRALAGAPRCPLDRAPCAPDQLKPPEGLARRVWSGVRVKCGNHGSGCVWTGSIENYEKHAERCGVGDSATGSC